jgi:hypothetical protein
MDLLLAEQVIEKLQTSMKSERDCWLTELPFAGLGTDVIQQIKAQKSRDKHWQGKCSGAVGPRRFERTRRIKVGWKIRPPANIHSYHLPIGRIFSMNSPDST